MDVTIYSRDEIEEILLNGDFPPNTATISFYDPYIKKIDPHYKHVDYGDKCGRVFFVELDDLDLDYLGENGLTYDIYFPEVDELVKFVYSAYAYGMDIICQCEYGQSRSAGCAAAILEHFYKNGISIFIDYKRYPNQVVYHKIFDALESVKTFYQKLWQEFMSAKHSEEFNVKTTVKALDSLSQREQKILELRVRYDKSFREIGEIMQMNSLRVEQIFNKAVQKLCHQTKRVKPREFDNE